jgi:hypothetical protein
MYLILKQKERKMSEKEHCIENEFKGPLNELKSELAFRVFFHLIQLNFALFNFICSLLFLDRITQDKNLKDIFSLSLSLLSKPPTSSFERMS